MAAVAWMLASPSAWSQAVNGNDELAQVLVVGTRSPQDDVEAHKRAPTAVEVLSTETTAALPAQTLAETIARTPGAIVERNEFGEGVSVTLRGAGPELQRVELDGQQLQSPGGKDLNLGGEGRGTDLRDLPAALLQTVTITKGATPDLTEGSLGASVRIRTRSGLDFGRRHVSARIAAGRNSLNGQWTPDLSLAMADRLLGGRAGAVLQLARSRSRNEAHGSESALGASTGYARLLDLDGSPDKTFSYSVDALDRSNAKASQPLHRAALIAGGVFESATPARIVEASAAAGSKADCHTAFPPLSQDHALTITADDRAPAIQQRSLELLSCLNQWNDETPSGIRYLIRRQDDARLSADLRVDVRVTPGLTLHVKARRSKRQVIEDGLALNPGGIRIDPVGSTLSGQTVTNIEPASVVVDPRHHVTRFAIADGSAMLDQTRNRIETRSSYLQLGGRYRHGPWDAEFLLGRASGAFQRTNRRVNLSAPYGSAEFIVQDDGSWDWRPAQGTLANLGDPALYSALHAPERTPMPRLSDRLEIRHESPRLAETREHNAKLDLRYAIRSEPLSFLRTLRLGAGVRDAQQRQWNGGSFTARSGGGGPTIIVPRVDFTAAIQACENTPQSMRSAKACAYGVSLGYSSTALAPTLTLPAATFTSLLGQSLQAPATRYMHGMPVRAQALAQGWPELDIDRLVALAGLPNFGLHCMKRCSANDGKPYLRPYSGNDERVMNAYVMTDFDLSSFAFGSSGTWHRQMALLGNFGWRYARTRTQGTGYLSFTSIRPAADWHPVTRPDSVISSSAGRMTTLAHTRSDLMPMLNLMFWPMRERLLLRYHRSKVVARPPTGQLLPQGSCTADFRASVAEASAFADDDAQRCGTIGNPALRPRVDISTDLSLEAYPWRGTMISISRFQLRGRTGAAIIVPVVGSRLFAEQGLIDPVTKAPLDTEGFSFNTYVNGPVHTRRGIELALKTACTSLPGPLRHTGLDLNYSKVRSTKFDQPVRELTTGMLLPPREQPAYSANASLWYDDGRLSARVGVQAVAQRFTALAPGGQTGAGQPIQNFPAAGVSSGALPYSPGHANFRDRSRWVDARLAYRITPHIEAFIEGRNLGQHHSTTSQGPFGRFADGRPALLSQTFPGVKISVGLHLKTQ